MKPQKKRKKMTFNKGFNNSQSAQEKSLCVFTVIKPKLYEKGNNTMSKVKVYDLMPNDGRKSFYGKARVMSRGNIHVLQSYNTDVCMIDSNGKVLRIWGGYSATTMRHVNAFLSAFGKDGGGKSWWNAQPVERFDWIAFYAGSVA